MTDWSYDPYDPAFTDRPSLPRKLFSRAAPALAAFSFSAVVALKLAGGLAEEAYNAPRKEPAPVAKSVAKVEPSSPVTRKQASQQQAANPFGALFDPDGSMVGVPRCSPRASRSARPFHPCSPNLCS